MTTLQFGGQTLQLNLGENTRAAQRAALASEEAAALASRFANDDIDTDVVGGAPGDRGAKYYALKAQADGAAQVALASGHRVRAGNGVPFLTWAALAAATGMSAGDRATVLAADTGTHTDPVVGGTVNNAGVYTYSSSPAGWQRTGDLDSQTAATQVAAVQAEGTTQVAAVTAAGTALAGVNVGIGIPAGDVSIQSYGAGGGTSNYLANYFIMSQIAPGKDELLTELTLEGSVGGFTATVHIVRLSDKTVQKVFTGLTPDGSGVVGESQFGGYVLPAGHTPAWRPSTGVVKYATGTEGGYFYAASEYNGTLGDAVTVSRNDAINAGIRFKTRAIAATHEERLDGIEPAVSDALRWLASDQARDAQVIYYGNADFTTSDHVSNVALGQASGIPFRALLPAFSVNVSKATYGELIIVNTRAGSVRRTLPFLAPATGKNRLIIPKGGVVIESGDMVFWRSISGGVMRTSAAGSGGTLTRCAQFAWTGVLPEGQAVTIVNVASGPVPSLQLELHRLPRPATERTPVFRQLFAGTSAPSDWTGTTTGVFSVSEGLSATGVGGWTSVASWNFNSAMHRKTIAASITVTATTDAGALGATCTVNSVAIAQGAIKFDGTTNTLSIWSVLGATAYEIKSVAIPALVAGRTYLLEGVQRGNMVFGRWTDTVTGARTIVSHLSYERFSNNCDLHGKPAYFHHSGTVKVNWFGLTNDLPKVLRAVIFGDSNAEGDAITPTLGMSWAHLAAERGAIGVSAIGGSITSDVLARFTADLAPHTVEKIIVASGTNDNSQANYRTRINAIIAALPAGTEMVLATQPPRTISNPSVGPLCNTDVRNRYFGAYRYVDFAVALSTGYDGSTMPAALFPDNLHMNPAAQELAFQCTKGSLPELFE